MTVKEAEAQTGLTRSNIRFYEKEKLITPSRNETNGYRDYSESDIETIKKIAYLRTLGISIEDIRNIMSQKISLHDAVEKQIRSLEGQIAELYQAKNMCIRILNTENISYESLQVENYVDILPAYWKDNRNILKLDSIKLLQIWGSYITWAVITALCLITSMIFYAELPPRIPIQWHGSKASACADKSFIFAYPAICIVLRCLLRPCIYAKLQMDFYYRTMVTEYLTNYLCFTALSVQIFCILFIYGLAGNVTTVLLVDTFILIGILIAVFIKINRNILNNK